MARRVPLVNPSGAESPGADSPGVEPLGIVELVTATTHLEATFSRLARRLGAWATGDDDVPDDLRRLFATMSHRHTWHAELWRNRIPAIPVEAAPGDTVDVPVDPDLDRYRSVVVDLERRIAALAERADPDLDPATGWAAHLTLANPDLSPGDH